MDESGFSRSLECPVCGRIIDGKDEEDLSTCIFIHFCEEHGMEVSTSEHKIIAGGYAEHGSDIERGGTRVSSNECKSAESSAQRGEDDINSEGSDMSQDNDDQFEEMVMIEEGRTREGSNEENAITSDLSDVSSNIFSVKCPGCKEQVTGNTESEISEKLRTHMFDEHGKESYMALPKK
ncbi:MAG: hypothetical protein GX369_02260 [Euryarchaeota archaeon]|nr:hypothetical protein [Euryarchaeota archaeon]